MVSISETAKVVTRYASLFPSCKMSNEDIVNYSQFVCAIPIPLLVGAFNRCVITSKFFPSVAELFESAQKVADEQKGVKPLPSAHEAYNEVLKQAKSVMNPKNWKFSCPEIEMAIDRFGRSEFCTIETSAIEVARKHFENIYDDVVARVNDQTASKRAVMMLNPERKSQLDAIMGASVKQLE